MIIVTGGAGFIGSNLLKGLEDRGVPDLVVADTLGTEEKWRNIAKRELADLVSPGQLLDFVDRHTRDIAAIFHMGAVSSTTERDADLIAQTNITLTLALLERCVRHGIRFIYASSAATYGDGSAGFDDAWACDDLSRLRPLNAYGWSKHVVDRRIARLVARGEAMPPQWAGLKFFNVYGPNEYHKGDMASVVSKLHPALTAGEPARLFRSYRDDYPHGGQRRDFIWVGDCVDVMLWFLDQPAVNGLFNLGTGNARTWLDLAGAVFAAIGRPPDIDFIDMPESLRPKYQYFTEAPMARLRSAGYDRPFTDLETGVDMYVRRFLSAADPYN